MIIAKNNWIETSLSQRSANNLCDFTVTVNPHPFTVDSFENNSIRVAKEIFEKHENVHLLFSGGTDSRYVIKVFMEQNLPIKPVLMVTPYNRYELEYAIDFFKRYNIKPLIYQYDKQEFFQTTTKLSHGKGYFSFLTCLAMDVCNKINANGGTVVNAYGDPFDVDSGNPKFRLTEWDFYLNYIPNNIGSFFLYDIAIQYSIANEFTVVGDLQQSKCNFYKLKYKNKRGIDPSPEFWDIFNKLKLDIKKFDVKMSLDQYKQILTGNQSFTIT